MTPRRPFVTENASIQIEEAVLWWWENRTAARGTLKLQIERALETIQRLPQSGSPVPHPRWKNVRRVILDNTGYTLYYRLTRDSVIVFALWHQSRGSGPPA